MAANFIRNSFGANLGWQPNEHHQIRLSLTPNEASDTDFPALPMDLRMDKTWLFSARHDVHLGRNHLKHWNSTLFGSLVDHRMDNLLKPLDPRMVNASTDASTYHFGGRTEGIWQWDAARLYLGVDFRAEGAEGIRIGQMLMGLMAGRMIEDNAWQQGRTEKSGLFGEYHWRMGKWQMTFAGRLELNTAHLNDEANEFATVYPDTHTAQLNPSLSMGGSLPLAKDKTLSIWLARAQRSVSLAERFINFFPIGQDPYEILGNPQILPETNHQVDIGFHWEQAQSSFGADFFVAYLTSRIGSLIDTTLSPRMPNSPGVRQMDNLGEAWKSRVELSWHQQLLWSEPSPQPSLYLCPRFGAG